MIVMRLVTCDLRLAFPMFCYVGALAGCGMVVDSWLMFGWSVLWSQLLGLLAGDAVIRLAEKGLVALGVCVCVCVCVSGLVGWFAGLGLGGMVSWLGGLVCWLVLAFGGSMALALVAWWDGVLAW